MDSLDLIKFFPILVEGLRETQDPYRFLADASCDDVIALGSDKILPLIPKIIPAVKQGLLTKKEEIVLRVLDKITRIIRLSPHCAMALVPYFG